MVKLAETSLRKHLAATNSGCSSCLESQSNLKCNFKEAYQPFWNYLSTVKWPRRQTIKLVRAMLFCNSCIMFNLVDSRPVKTSQLFGRTAQGQQTPITYLLTIDNRKLNFIVNIILFVSSLWIC